MIKRLLSLTEIKTQEELGREETIDDVQLDVSSNYVSLQDLIKLPWFRHELNQLGWVNRKFAEGLTEDDLSTSPVYTMVRWSGNHVTASLIDSEDPERSIPKANVDLGFAVEIKEEALKRINKTLYNAYIKVKEDKKKKEEKAKQDQDRMQKLQIENAKKLLKEAGIYTE